MMLGQRLSRRHSLKAKDKGTTNAFFGRPVLFCTVAVAALYVASLAQIRLESIVNQPPLDQTQEVIRLEPIEIWADCDREEPRNEKVRELGRIFWGSRGSEIYIDNITCLANRQDDETIEAMVNFSYAMTRMGMSGNDIMRSLRDVLLETEGTTTYSIAHPPGEREVDMLAQTLQIMLEPRNERREEKHEPSLHLDIQYSDTGLTIIISQGTET